MSCREKVQQPGHPEFWVEDSALLAGSWVVVHGVFSRVATSRTHIRGLI